MRGEDGEMWSEYQVEHAAWRIACKEWAKKVNGRGLKMSYKLSLAQKSHNRRLAGAPGPFSEFRQDPIGPALRAEAVRLLQREARRVSR